MELRYDEDDDILTIDQGAPGDTIEHAEEVGSVIAHFTSDGRAILLEILDASEFLAAANHAIASRSRGKTVERGEP
jgi:uncharacterized protein YuzE